MLLRVMARRRELIRVFAIWISTIGCQVKAESPSLPYPAPDVLRDGKIVAQIGNVTLTTRELERRLANQSPFTRRQLSDPEKLRGFVDNQIRMEVLAQEGWDRGLPTQPQVLERFKQVVVEQLTREALDDIATSLDVTEVDMQQAYRARYDEFNKPPRIRVSHITRHASSPAEKAAALKLLRRLKKEITEAERKNDLKIFTRHARDHSDDPMARQNGGDVRFLTHDELTARFGTENAAKLFDLPVGEMLIGQREGFVILFKKTGQRRGLARTLEQVKPQIRARLIADKRTEAFDAFIKKLKKKRGVTIDETAIDGIVVPRPDKPSASPN